MKKTRRQDIKEPFWIVFFCIVSVLFQSCDKHEDSMSMPDKIQPICIMEIDPAESPKTFMFSGTIKAETEIPLSSRNQGTIDTLPIREGMEIRKGDLIARLGSKDYELSFKQADEKFQKAKTILEKTKSDYENYKRLHQSGSVSKNKIDRATEKFQSAQIQVDTLQEGFEFAREKLEYCTLRASLPGIIISVLAENQQVVSQGQIIATVALNGEMMMEAEIPESLLRKIHIGEETTVSVNDIPNEKFIASISQIDPQLTEAKTHHISMRILSKDTRLRSGMVGKITLEIKPTAEDGVIALPPVAVFNTPYGDRSVWLYRSWENKKFVGTVKRRNVKIGDITPKGLQILDGITASDIIVIRGVHRLYDGMKVRVLQECEI